MDFVRGWIKVLDPDHPGQVESFASGLTRPVDLAFGADGALYVLLRDAWVIDGNFRPGTGSLLKIRHQRSSGESSKDRIVRVSDVTIHGNMDCFRVETPRATYVYGKRGAGFASIIDKDGRDWVSYRPGGEARGEYRGLPKCGQPTKFFHCGYGYGQYQTDNPFSSRVTVREAEPRPHRVGDTRRQVGLPVGFLPRPCDLDALADRSADVLVSLRGNAWRQSSTPKRDFVIRPDGQKTTLDQPWSQVVPWVCFGSAETPVGFRPRQSPGARAGRGRLVRVLAVPQGAGRLVSGHDRIWFRPQGIQGVGRARSRPQAAPRSIQIAFVDRADAATAT